MSGIGLFLTAWTLMVAVMMLPTVAPFALAYGRRAPDRRVSRVAAFVAGYLVVWIAVAAPAYPFVRLTDLLAARHARDATFVGAVLFVGFALYQLTEAKAQCLARCRPTGAAVPAIAVDRRTSDAHAGLRHGAACLGCCWATMLLLVAFGMMNPIAMASITAVMVLERSVLMPPWFARGLACTAVALACAVLFVPTLTPGLHHAPDAVHREPATMAGMPGM